MRLRRKSGERSKAGDITKRKESRTNRFVGFIKSHPIPCVKIPNAYTMYHQIVLVNTPRSP